MNIIDLDEFENLRSNGYENIIAIYDEETKQTCFAVVDEDEKDFTNKKLYDRFCDLCPNLQHLINIRRYWVKD